MTILLDVTDLETQSACGCRLLHHRQLRILGFAPGSDICLADPECGIGGSS
jgi:hypothetical protein